MRYPPLPEGVNARQMPPDLPADVRAGKNALWMAIADQPAWQSRLLEVLSGLPG